jgi:hypothetical protein
VRPLYPFVLAALLVVPACQSDRSTNPSGPYRSPDLPAEDDNVPSRAPGFALFSMGSIEASGNVDVCGRVHANIDVAGGGSAFDAPDSCEGGVTVSDSALILPHWIKTQPRYYPNTTYYYVVGKPAGTDSVWICRAHSDGPLRIRSGNGVRVAWLRAVAAGTGGNALVRYSTPDKITYQFTDNTRLDTYFNQITGVFARDAGDETVIVNFGEYLDGASARTADLVIGDSNSLGAPVRSTIINTRFVGIEATQSALVESDNWVGGTTEFRTVEFGPLNGIGFIAHNIDSPSNSAVRLGSAPWPSVLFLTGDIVRFNANGSVVGSVVTLGDMVFTGGPDFWFEGSFEGSLPDYLRGFWGPVVILEES